MKTLFFLRHGKSDWEADYETDHERPLAKRGIKASRKIGRFLNVIGEVPEVVISSTAERAIRTASLANEAGNWERDIRSTRKLYEASPTDLLDVIRALDDGFDAAMLVGHEPTWSSAVGLFSGANVRFPTTALARIDFERDRWESISPQGGQLIWLVVPKSLPDDI